MQCEIQVTHDATCAREKKTNREEQGRKEDADAMRARPGRSGLQCNEEEEEKQGKKTRKTLN